MRTPDIAEEWEDRGATYREKIASGSTSSTWLRDTVLKPEVIRMLGDRRCHRVLDAGTGSGWLFDEIDIGERHACDIAKPESIRSDVAFVEADVASLPYSDGYFDAILANLVLCYCPDLDIVATELRRVCAIGGTLVVSLVHPDFYRTGREVRGDKFVVEADLSISEHFEIAIGGRVGPFTYYRRSIAKYLNTLIRAGWRLEEMSELFIPRSEYEAKHRADDLVQRSTRVPLFAAFQFKADK